MWSGYIASCFCLQEMEISKIARLHVFMVDPNRVSCDRGQRQRQPRKGHVERTSRKNCNTSQSFLFIVLLQADPEIIVLPIANIRKGSPSLS